MGITHTAAELRELIAAATAGDEISLHRLQVLQELGYGNGVTMAEGDVATAGLDVVVADGEVRPSSSAE